MPTLLHPGPSQHVIYYLDSGNRQLRLFATSQRNTASAPLLFRMDQRASPVKPKRLPIIRAITATPSVSKTINTPDTEAASNRPSTR